MALVLGMLDCFDASDQRALLTLGAASCVAGLCVTAGRRRAAWLTWIAALATVTLPITDFHAEPAWWRVGWVPFMSPPIKLADVVANVVLYMPFGFLGAEEGRRNPIAATVVAATVLSTITETSQLFSLTRFPSTTDVASNALGALVGASVAIALARRQRGARAVHQANVAVVYVGPLRDRPEFVWTQSRIRIGHCARESRRRTVATGQVRGRQTAEPLKRQMTAVLPQKPRKRL
jgi:VanZ family protein